MRELAKIFHRLTPGKKHMLLLLITRTQYDDKAFSTFFQK